MLDFDRGLQALAASTSRRSVLARLGKGLIGAALISNAFPRTARATSCGCAGNTKCSVSCGSTASSSSFCCSCNPPCWDCGGGQCSGVANCSGASCCVGSGFTQGWYWYCCKPGPSGPEGAIEANNLWKCQDCCNEFGDCYTSRDTVGSC